MPCPQCKAMTKFGVRCKNTTCRQYPYCWTHLKSIDKLQVKNSTVPNAGKGLFYVGKKKFPKGKKIVDYSAKTITNRENPNSDYVLKVGDGRYLDSKDTSNYVGRYINDGRGNNNVRFTKGSKIFTKNNRKVIPIYSTKVIKPNTELKLNYGRTYWNKR